MEIIEFKKVLAKALSIVDVGIKKGYFRAEKKEELTQKLVSIIKNGIVYDIYGTAIYGAYIPREKKLYFNAKVFKNEQEALIYILHEIKHGLDHYDNTVGFENNGNLVGMNEGATQRFANDIAEEILGISIQKIPSSSLGIDLETQLDEYQIEDRLNELFCIALGIPIEQFIVLQNDENKAEFNKLIEQFNQYADFNRFSKALDMIYKIQEETWSDSDGNIVEEEKKPTEEQTKRAIDLINICKEELLKYAMVNNIEVADKIKENFMVKIDEYGHIILDREIKSDENDLIRQFASNQLGYNDYCQNLISFININNYVNGNYTLIFVTEYGYDEDKDDKIIYLRSGEVYKKIIVPVKDDGKIDLSNIRVLDVENKEEILNKLDEWFGEGCIVGNGYEYAKLLNEAGQNDRAERVTRIYEYYLKHQDEIRQEREQEKTQSMGDILSLFREKLDQEENSHNLDSISYGQYFVYSDSIIKFDDTGTIIHDISSEEKKECIEAIQDSVNNGSLVLDENQLSILENWQEKINRTQSR